MGRARGRRSQLRGRTTRAVYSLSLGVECRGPVLDGGLARHLDHADHIESEAGAGELAVLRESESGPAQAMALAVVDSLLWAGGARAATLDLNDHDGALVGSNRQQVKLISSHPEIPGQDAIALPFEKAGGGRLALACCPHACTGHWIWLPRSPHEGECYAWLTMSIVILEHSPNFGAGILARGLRTLGSRLRIIRVDRGEALPPDLDGITGLVSCGGPQSAYGNEPWLAAEMSLIRDAHGAGVPVVGLCLGAQLLAQALGGEVKKSATPELGWFNVSLSPVGREDPVLAGIPWTSTQFCWHFDEIVTAPPEARILASSERCRVQAFAVGLFSYGFQYHFEWDRAIILKEVDEYGDEVRSAGASPEAIRSGVDQHAAVAERLAERLTERIALCLMPVDRVNRGIVRDLHH